MDLAEILQPVKYDEKSIYTTKSDRRRTWREKIVSKHDKKTQRITSKKFS